ncbi:MAG: CHAT domain-containing protein [Myxococcales bacterium]|nr:CHAT domain-containing protein [Myxococcales bacterium]
MTTLPTDRLIEGLSEADRAAWEGALQRYRDAREAPDADARPPTGSDRTGAALAAAQAARADQVRTLRGLLDAAVARLGRPAAAEGALRGPEPGEIILLWTALPGDRWLVFAQDAAGTTAAEVTPGAWTAPVRARIQAAERVRVLAAGPIAEARLDLAGRPAVHALDLPPRAARPLGPMTMLVADPTGDLPGARQEAERVAPLLEAAGRPATRIAGAAVTRAALADALGVADHLHYAGHGRYAGFEGWDSALPVHDGALEVGDLLLLPRVPAAVVLSGCETGRARGDAAVGLGLAHAFLVRGADAVVAPIGPVDDTIAADFAVALYRALARAERLETAFGAVAADSSAQDYRLFVP